MPSLSPTYDAPTIGKIKLTFNFFYVKYFCGYLIKISSFPPYSSLSLFSFAPGNGAKEKREEWRGEAMEASTRLNFKRKSQSDTMYHLWLLLVCKVANFVLRGKFKNYLNPTFYFWTNFQGQCGFVF